jgi:hypothetical protein
MRRNVNMPIRKGSDERFNPLSDACLTFVDLLTSPNKTHDDRPIEMAVET